MSDPDGNLFLDFTAGIAVTSTGHCHPKVVKAIQKQSKKYIHMSGTDFYYEPQIELAERLAKLAPGKSKKKVFLRIPVLKVLKPLLNWQDTRPNVKK